MDEHDIFSEARNIDDLEKRLVFLQRACAGDESMVQRIERLLDMDGNEFPVLDRNPASLLLGMGDVGNVDQSELSSESSNFVDQVTAILLPSDRAGSLGRLGHYDIDKIVGQGGGWCRSKSL